MTPELKETVKNFLVDFDHTASDLESVADYSFWMDTAVNLLEKIMEDDK